MPQDILTPVERGEISAVGDVTELKNLDPMLELGTTGLRRSGGYVDEEFLPQLKGRKAAQVYREMGDNDPITGALLFSITQLLAGIDYVVEPGGKTKQHARGAHLIETSMNDMSSSWSDTLMEIFTCLQYGWAMNEIVYKQRRGPSGADGRYRSRYSDGLWGWRKMPLRSQETLHRWIFDESGDTKAMVQLAPPDYRERTIPLERSLLFRFGHHKNNPEGRSILRTSYRPWFYKKRLEEFESVGVERDLAGLPMVKMPAEYLRAKPGSQQHAMVMQMQKMVRSIRRNEQEGLVFPTAYDPETKQPLFSFELLTSGGSRQHDTNQLIQRYEQRQLMTVLADFIMVGHQGSTGTYNLHVDKTGIFRQALNATAENICDVFNRHAIPRLFKLNGWAPDELPTIVPSNVENPDLGQLASFLTSTAALGYNWGPDADIERMLRKASGLPDLNPQEIREREKRERIATSTRFATEQAAMLAATSSLRQAQATEQAVASGQLTPAQELEATQAAEAQQQQSQPSAKAAPGGAQ